MGWLLFYFLFLLNRMSRGVFRGSALCHGPPFGMLVMHKYLRIVRKIESFPPLLWNLGRKSGPKDGLNLGEDFFLVFTKIWEEKQAKSG